MASALQFFSPDARASLTVVGDAEGEDNIEGAGSWRTGNDNAPEGTLTNDTNQPIDEMGGSEAVDYSQPGAFQADNAPSANVKIQFVAKIRQEFDRMKRWRETHQRIDIRITKCMQAKRGIYDAQTLQEIRKVGGSEIYCQMTANKTRGAAAMLEEIFLDTDRPWRFDPSPVPSSLEDMIDDMETVIVAQQQEMAMQGTPLDDDALSELTGKMYDEVSRTALMEARDKAHKSTQFIDDFLVEGKFYEALAEFIEDFTSLPFAVMKGPVVRMRKSLDWKNGVPTPVYQPTMEYECVRPHRLWWTPGAFDVNKTDFVEVIPQTRADLQAMIGVPGFEEAAVRACLEEYKSGLREWHHENNEINRLEGRHDSMGGEYDFIDVLEFNGRIQGSDLLKMGVEVDDPQLDYLCRAWMCGRYLLKVQVDPDPWERMPYYIASYEPVPGSLIGKGPPEIMEDIQHAANACMRSLLNNMSIASGPQVIINDFCVANKSDPDDLYPWKRWHIDIDPSLIGVHSMRPIDFYQPNSNVQELLMLFNSLTTLADEVTALPRFLTGGTRASGAARTSSGLAQLTGNAARTMKSVARQIDTNVLSPAITKLHAMVMMQVNRSFLQGDEHLTVRGATKAEEIEKDKMRMLEFLQITSNPIDQALLGPDVRAKLLHGMAKNLGQEVEHSVPTLEQLQARLATLQGQGGEGGGAGNPAPAPGSNDIAQPIRSQSRAAGSGLPG